MIGLVIFCTFLKRIFPSGRFLQYPNIKKNRKEINQERKNQEILCKHIWGWSYVSGLDFLKTLTSNYTILFV